MIAIIGAGIGGLTTALAFEKFGIDYHIYEKAEALNEVGAGIWLAPNALQVFDWLDILPRIQQVGNTIDRITLGLSDLTPLSDTAQDLVKEKFGYSTIAIHRATLQKILFDLVPKDKKSLGKAFSSYGYVGDSLLKMSFQDGTEVYAEKIVGADGIHSAVRKMIFPESETRYSGQTCWRGVANISLAPDFKQRGLELWGGKYRFGISQISADQVYWFAVGVSEAKQPMEADVKAFLLETYKDFIPLVTTMIEATAEENIIKNDISDLLPLEKWYTDDVLLIGDAAHATTPNMGQGGAQAIEDAFALAHIMMKYPENEVFEVFQKARYKKVNQIVKQSWTTGQLAHWSYGRRVRNLLMKSVPKKLLLKKMMEMYTIESLDALSLKKGMS